MAALAIEPAQPGDAVAAAPLIFETGPALSLYLFGGDRETFMDFFAEQWRRPEGLFSHVHARVVRDGGLAVGLELGWDLRTRMAEYVATARIGSEILPGEVLKEYQARYASHVRYFTPEIPMDAYYVQFLSVAADRHGQGLGRALLQDAFERARGAGQREVHLDVHAPNPAVGFYRAMGMDLRAETRVPHLEAEGIENHYRMVYGLA